jgi:fibronectin type 3 domain-containing protein
MATKENVNKKRRLFSMTATVVLVLSSLLVGITLQVPNAKAVTHNVGNVDINQLTDFGRILGYIYTSSSRQTVTDPSTGNAIGFIGLVLDHDGYDHTPGSEQVADCFGSWPYAAQDDLSTVNAATFVVNDGTLQKSIATFQNTALSTGDPDDIIINQTCWTVVNEDWAIIQWAVSNLKGVAINDFSLGLEVPLSVTGGGYGLGGDSGDDIDGFDAVESTYWAQDDSGTTIGFSSAIALEPINHYYAADYNTTYTFNEYAQNLFSDDAWLYNRIRAPNAVVGVTPGNRTTTVGWNGVTITPGSIKTFTMVIAINDSVANMGTAVQSARDYYNTVASRFYITEFSDADSAFQQIEVYSQGVAPTDMAGSGYFLSVDGPLSPLAGTWDKNPLPTYEYGLFNLSAGSIGPEGDTIELYRDLGGGNYELIDLVAYGQEGLAPDPLTDESVARHYDTGSMVYTNEWLRNETTGPTWGFQNNVSNVITSPPVVINRVMFNPLDPAEGYIELSWKGIPISIANYRVMCDGTTSDAFIVPAGTVLDANNPFYVITESMAPGLFASMDSTADNVYLYNSAEDRIDEVGWSSSHTQGYFMSRMPDGSGTTTGFNDTTSVAAGWIFDQQPSMQITEISVDDANTARIELYNNRGGDKVASANWKLNVSGGELTGTWNSGGTIPSGGYDYFDRTGGPTLDVEGDTISLCYGGSVLIDEISYGTKGIAPDPLTSESTARYWDDSAMAYTSDWTREETPTFGVQNAVPAINSSSYLILNEVMFNPSVVPDGKYVIIINRMVGSNINFQNYSLVCDGIYQIPNNISLGYLESAIIRYNDDSPASDTFFDSIDSAGDNIYLYQPDWKLCDMVGWNTSHQVGMNVGRIPAGNGTQQGYDDISSEAAGWVFDNPMDVIITEISDDNSTTAQIEVYNPWYSSIDFNIGYSFESDSGTLIGNWGPAAADAGQYALFNLSAAGLNPEGDSLGFYQNGILIEEIGYGQNGETPDPLDDESVQRYWTGVDYTDIWGRNYTTGPNFGSQNDIPTDNLSSNIMLNEILFYPNLPDDGFVEVINKGSTPIDISGYKLVCDTEYIIPVGTVLEVDEIYKRNFYLFYSMDNPFFDQMDASGDNVYLYDDNGSLLDMVGWSSIHSIGKTMSRIPDGNGTRNGYDDFSSYMAGWRFDRTPTVRLIIIETWGNEYTIKYGNFGDYIIFNLTIINFQSIGDVINIINSSEEGWQVEIYDETMTTKISQIPMTAKSMVNITVKITMPDTIPFAVMDNITVEIHSTNSNVISDQIVLNPRVLGFLYPEKSVSPTEIYVNGSGSNETATVTLNVTGHGAWYPIDNYADCVFCIDSSGSMALNDPANLRITESQNFITNHFQLPDRGAVVDFDLVATLLPASNPNGDHLSTNYPQIINNLGLIDSNGGTDLSNGLNLSNAEMDQYGDLSSKVPVIILITDAESLQAGDDTESLAEADYAAAMGVIIMTIGLNIPQDGASELLLKEIANITGGMYYRASNASFFSDIYASIATFIDDYYQSDLAAWDNNTADNSPMVRDVLPPWIDYVPGNFSLPPDSIYVNASGYTFIEWNVPWIKIGETWSVSFDIKSNMVGYIEANNYTSSRIKYTNWENTTVERLFPLTMINVLDALPTPGAPINLGAAAGVGFINLTWDAPLSDGGSPITNYYVYKGTSSGSETLYMIIGNLTTFNDTSVTPGITYYYKVSAVNVNGEGPLSNEASATPPTVPFAPINLAAAAGIGYIDLTWDVPSSDGGSPITNYRIYRGTSSGSEVFYMEIGNLTTYNDTSVTPGTTYYYRVSAVNIIGEGPLSNEAFDTPPTVPSAPINLAAESGNAYVNLSWDIPASDGGAPIIEFYIYRNGTGGNYDSVPAGQLWYNDTGVINGITYTYNVSAVNGVGEGPPSIGTNATPMTVPSAPQNLQALAGIGYIDLTWDIPVSDGGSPITSYRIYRGTSSGSEVFYVEIGNFTTYNDTSVIPGTTYYYQVSAVNIIGEGPLSNEAFDTAPTVPSAPVNLAAESGNAYVNLSWDIPASDGGSPIIAYNIYRNDTIGIYDSVPAGQLWYNDTGVANGITYTYNVSAVNGVGEGPLSVGVNATPMTIPSAPENLQAIAGIGYIDLTWDVPSSNGGSPITNYRIYRGTSSGSEVFYVEVGNLTTYNDTGVTPGTTYYYQVSAVNIVGEGPLSNEAFDTPPTVPSAPLNLVTTAGIGYIDLTWDVPVSDGGSPITNYTIYRGTSSGSEVFYVEIGNFTTYNDTSVIPGTTYYYQVSAVNIVGEGPLSNEAFDTPPTVPSAPVNLAAESGNAYVNLSWDIPASDGGSPIIEYYIYRNGTGGSYDSVPAGQLWYNDTGVTNGITYTYNVSAINGVGEGPLSIGITATPMTVPSAPENLQAFAGIGYIDLTWDVPSSDGGSPISNYRIYRGMSSGSEVFYVEIGNLTTYNDTSVNPGTTYYYQVSAVNIVGEGLLSNEAFDTPPTVPSAPINLAAESGNVYVNLSWDIPASDGGSPILEYYIYRNGTGGNYDAVPAGQLWYNDTSVTNGITYTYNVSAVNGVGEGPLSIGVNATPMTVPSAPQNLQALAGDGFVNLTWGVPSSDGGSPIIGYYIYRDDTQGYYDFITAEILWFNDTNVVNGITYIYNVSAVNEVGEGPNSTVSATPSSPPMPPMPSPPMGLMASPGDGEINVSWESPSDTGGIPITAYNIYRNGESQIYATVPSDQLWFIDSSITSGTIYSYQITASNNMGEGALSGSAGVKAGTVPSSPTNIAVMAGDSYVLIDWDAPISDGEYQITNYSIYRGETLGGESLLIVIGNTTSYNDTGVTNDVIYYYFITAVNAIGESLFSESVNGTPSIIVIVVNQPPTVFVTSPSSGSTIEGSYEIFGTASDPEGSVQRVEIMIDGISWIQASGTSSWSHEWDTTTVPNGQHTITARAFDGIGYSPEVNITVDVNNPEPEEPQFEQIWLWIFIIIVLIIVLLVLWIYKNKTSKEEEIEEGPAETEMEEEPDETETEEGEPEQPQPTEEVASSAPQLPLDLTDEDIYDLIKKKYEDGIISEKTFEDFKKRYGK